MKKIKFIFPLFLLLVLIKTSNAQTYMQPYIGVGLNHISNVNNGNSLYPGLANDIEPSYSVGLGLEHFFSKKISIEAFFNYNRLELRTTETNFASGPWGVQTSHSTINKFVKGQHILGGSLKLFLTDRIRILGGANYIAHGKAIAHNYQYWDDSSYRIRYPVAIKELGVFVGTSYAITDRFIASFIAQRVIWQNDNHEYTRLSSISTVSLQLAYRIKVFDKFKKKSKVNCPKL